MCITECDGEDGRAVNLETQGHGFYTDRNLRWILSSDLILSYCLLKI